MYATTRLDDIEEVGKAFPSRLVVMLYDEAIASLIAAIDAIGKGDIEGRCFATERAIEVISQLYLALDMEDGGEIAESLGGIYNYILSQLPRINFDNDPDIAGQAVKLLRPMRKSWFELDERIRAEALGDIAAEMSRLTSRQILVQAGVAMLAQANQAPQNLLRLFQ